MNERPSLKILLTGASFGLGLAMAKEFLALGHRVVGCGRSDQKLLAARSTCPDLICVQADVTRAEDREKLFSTFAGEPPDMLINNAAICHAHDYTNTFTLSSDRAREEIETNLAAPIELTRLFLSTRNLAEPATIVNISTPGALFPMEASPLYAATKAGFHSFTLALRRQLRGTGVRVVEVFPPGLDTGLSPDLIVPMEDAGDNAIAEVAKRSVEGILAGEETILPHPQSVELVTAIGGNVEQVADTVNERVKRRPGWATP